METLKWFDKPFLGRYSIVEIIRSLFAVIFIFTLMSSLTIYVHSKIETASLNNSQKLVEYVTIDKDVDVSKSQTINLVVENTFIFPIHYKDKLSTGYILKDMDTGVKYIYTNTGGERGGSTFTRYWEK